MCTSFSEKYDLGDPIYYFVRSYAEFTYIRRIFAIWDSTIHVCECYYSCGVRNNLLHISVEVLSQDRLKRELFLAWSKHLWREKNKDLDDWMEDWVPISWLFEEDGEDEPEDVKFEELD